MSATPYPDYPEIGRATVGDLLAAFLEANRIDTAYGVISVHNLPLLDALARAGKARYVCARGEAGVVNMADAHARITGWPAVAFTSTGAGAGNACGALIEALTAGTPLLHVTGQVNADYLDRGLGDVHEAKDQLGMLEAAGKRAFRVWTADTAAGVLREALRCALTPPCGPVSVEIPIDVQNSLISHWPASLRIDAPAPAIPDEAALDVIANQLLAARRPLLWCGGGARHAGNAVRRLLDMGFGLVTTIQGRAVVDEHDPRSLGAFNAQPAIAEFYRQCDAVLVVGSRLRVPETARHSLPLPQPLLRIDVDPRAEGRGYPNAAFALGDARLTLEALADRLEGRMRIDADHQSALAGARARAEAMMRDNLGSHAQICDALQAAAGHDINWVRDVTIANGTWGARLFRLHEPGRSAHASGGGIGQALSMAIGAAVASPSRRTLALVGDGGLALNAAELPTAVQENTGLVLLVMNDRGYGILRNLADAQFNGRRIYADLHTPDFEGLAAAHGYVYHRIGGLDDLENRLRAILAERPPATLIEFDLDAIGPMARPFAGPRI
ncbi:MAG: thiamine pyrophosphate-binding protein [Burkholderiaceae bacterium]